MAELIDTEILHTHLVVMEEVVAEVIDHKELVLLVLIEVEVEQ